MGDLATLLSAVDELNAPDRKIPLGGSRRTRPSARRPGGQILLISDGIMAMVAVSGNNARLLGSKTTPSAWTKSSIKLIDIATRVHGAGTENATALADYGITAAELEELDEVGGLRGCENESAGGHRRPRGGDGNLAGVDPGCDGPAPFATRQAHDALPDGDPEFFAEDQSARVIVDRRGPGTPEPVAPMPSA